MVLLPGGLYIIYALGSFKLLIEGLPVLDPWNPAGCELFGILLYFGRLSEIGLSINLDCYDEF